MNSALARPRGSRESAPDAPYGEVEAFARSLFDARPVERHALFVALAEGRLTPAEEIDARPIYFELANA